MKIEEKAVYFAIALSDVYKDDDRKSLHALEKIEFSDDPTEDFIAMLLAINHVYEQITGDGESDLIDFTHLLNKLAIQYVMERVDDDGK